MRFWKTCQNYTPLVKLQNFWGAFLYKYFFLWITFVQGPLSAGRLAARFLFTVETLDQVYLLLAIGRAVSTIDVVKPHLGLLAIRHGSIPGIHGIGLAGDKAPVDGYYLVGTESSWKYAGATKMSAGSEGNKAELLGYKAKANEIFKVRSYLNGVDTWYGSNYEVGAEAKDLDIYLNNAGEVYVFDHVVPDVPAEEGYYICGEFSSVESWTYENASKMVSPSGIGDNVAHLMNFNVAAGDKLRVRSYYNDQEPKDRWAKLGTGIEDYGHPSKSSEDPEEYDNFEFDKAGYYEDYSVLRKKIRRIKRI